MAVKIPLKMSDGTPVKTIEELRKHFRLADVLGYYSNGRLIKWLEDWYYDEEAKEVAALDSEAEDFPQKLCEILGVNYSKCLKEEAGQEEAETQFTTGIGYLREGETEEAYKCFRMAAEQGHVDANVIIYTFYYVILGTETAKEAVKWFVKADEQDGYFANMAREKLGECYMEGLGVRQDAGEAVKWFRKAAEQGNALAQYYLGQCYYDGEGIKKNNEEAFRWFYKAAEQGYEDAQCSLGVCYYYGEGVEKNVQEAKKWYQEAAEQGNELAQSALETLF